MIRRISAVFLSGVMTLALAACAGTGGGTPAGQAPSGAELRKTVSYQRLSAMSGAEATAQLSIAMDVEKKCALIDPNPNIGPLLRPMMNRAVVFQGKDMMKYTMAAQRAAIEKKYGLSLTKSADLCPIAKGEIAEQGPLAIFWVNKGL